MPKESLTAMRESRPGMLATPALLQYFGWKVGDAVILRSQLLKTDGTSDWTFNIVGTFRATSDPDASFGIINYSYLDESRVLNRGTEGETVHVLKSGDRLEFGPPADCEFRNAGEQMCRYLVALVRQ